MYHIEKGDYVNKYQHYENNPISAFIYKSLGLLCISFIEPANITGQLIINNLSEGLTLTPTVNVIQDSNQVDFSLFKGKHIRISQYTNTNSKYDVFYLYDDMRKAGVKLNEVVFNATPKPFEEQKYIATICLSKDFSDIHYGTLLFYHKNKDVIDYKYSLGLDNFEFHTVNEYWDNGEDGYLFFDTGNALNNRIFKTLSSSLDKYNECSKYIKNGINCIAYLREIPQYGEWIIGDMVVVDGNTYAYNGKLWLDASGTPSSVVRSGITGERPQNVLAGFCYFDKTINKPVWWNGSSWTDASGATV